MSRLRSSIPYCDRFALALLAGMVPFQFSTPVLAETVASAVSQIGPSPQRLRSLSQQLQSQHFTQRRAAAMTLMRMGTAAHPTLEKIATSGDANAASLAIDLLTAALENDDPQVSENARSVLTRISQSDQAFADSARTALSPKPSNPVGRAAGVPLLRPMPRVALAFAPLQGGRTQINIRNINGVREITVVRNRDRFKFRDAGKGLEVECPDGNGGVKTFTCRDEKELQQKDMQAFWAYQSAGGAKAGRRGLPRLPIQNPQPPKKQAPR